MSRDVLSSSKRAKRRKVAFRALVVFLFFILLSGGVVVGLFSLDALRIKSVVIKGNFVLREEDLRASIQSITEAKIFGIIPQDRIFSFPSKKIKKFLLDRFGRISIVEIKKDLRANVLVEIEERKPAALWCEEGEEGSDSENCFFIDKEGFVFEKAPLFSAGVFLKFFDKRSSGFDREGFKKILEFKNRLDPFFSIGKIQLKDNGVCEIYMSDGKYLILDIKTDLNLVYDNLMILLSDVVGQKSDKNLEYIDLRFGNKVFFKWQ